MEDVLGTLMHGGYLSFGDIMRIRISCTLLMTCIDNDRLFSKHVTMNAGYKRSRSVQQIKDKICRECGNPCSFKLFTSKWTRVLVCKECQEISGGYSEMIRRAEIKKINPKWTLDMMKTLHVAYARTGYYNCICYWKVEFTSKNAMLVAAKTAKEKNMIKKQLLNKN